MDANLNIGLAMVVFFMIFLWLWAFIAMLRLPSWAYQDAGSSKGLGPSSSWRRYSCR